MTHYNVVFPETFAFAGSWGPAWAVLLDQSPGGYRKAEAVSPLPRGRYTAPMRNRTAAETQVLIAFFNAIGQGKAHSFLLRDTNPGESQGTNEPLGTGNGVLQTFQLTKRYTLGSYTFDRTITKPNVVSTVYLNGVATMAYTVSATTGVITTTAPVSNGVAVTATFSFYVPVRFDTDKLQLTIIEPGIYSWENLALVALREHASA